MLLFDSHCHLDASAFAADRDAVLARARQHGVTGQLIPATHRAGWAALTALCAEQADLHAALGLHPMYLAQHHDSDLDALPDWLIQHKAIAVGECGLDFFVDGLDPDRQRTLFMQQLHIARELNLPVVIHARRAVEEVILSIRQAGPLTGVIHSYSGSEEQARQLYALGFCLGIGGPVTHTRATRLRQLVATLPLEHLLLETDAPDQPGACHHGQRNEPGFLPEVLRVVAALRNEDEETIAKATTDNAKRLFRLT